ncbi:hypothetical protein [Nostoc sp. JL23]|nr:hypothetical protein [Nostoc sp. JL23]
MASPATDIAIIWQAVIPTPRLVYASVKLGLILMACEKSGF